MVHVATGFPKLDLSIRWMIEGMFTAATILISFGAVIGRLSALQLVFMAFVETFFYSLNLFIGNMVLGAVDAGGSMFIHIFGAYFGLACSRSFAKALVSEDEKVDAKSRYHSDIFAMVRPISVVSCILFSFFFSFVLTQVMLWHSSAPSFCGCFVLSFSSFL